MTRQEDEMANIIYDTLMKNLEFQQFPTDDISDQLLDTGLEHPEITFTEQGYRYRIIIHGEKI